MTIQQRLEQQSEEIINKYKSGIKTIQLGKEYNCNPGTIWFFLKNKGIEITKKSETFNNNIDYLSLIKKYLLEDKSAYQMSKLLNISKATVLRIMKQNGLSTSHKSTAREDKLKNYTNEIIKLYNEDKLTLDKIANIYKCNSVSILNILNKNGFECRSINKYTCNYNFFEKVNNDNVSFLLGWWYTDGNNKKNNEGIRLEICDLQILEEIKNILEYTGPIYCKGRKSERHQVQYSLSISSKKISKDLENLGCPPNKTFLLKFPDENIVPKEFLKSFLKGVFEGDGGISKSKKGSWSLAITGTKHMMDGIKKYTGIKFNFRQRFPERGKDNWTISISNKDKIFKFLNLIYKDSTIHLKRKYDKYLEFLKEYEEENLEIEKLKESNNQVN